MEVLVRLFHLYNDTPDWNLAKDNTYKRVPGQTGYAVYGNRRQVMAPYRINSSGYNSFRDFDPVEDEIEIAIFGDSFIEGFHQDYRNSLGKKVERGLSNVQVYEYGHSNFDLADVMYLVNTNTSDMDKIDFIVYAIDYEYDLMRDTYKVVPRKVVFPLLRHSKFLVYLLDIGMIDQIKKVLRKWNVGQAPREGVGKKIDRDSLFLHNFKTLTNKYGLEKKKVAFLLDGRHTSDQFLKYLSDNGIQIIDYGLAFQVSEDQGVPTTLIYDQHWNDHGRELIAEQIIDYFNKKNQYNSFKQKKSAE
ncbi:hypothetical protein F8C76_02955 [Flagellimonas olearia]|uniref:SGNH/GDSL hydrolase family protein n=1 Tax=Flagellimonas olearia TaxID=552546 RepID=A0A6I1E3E0_9FLAO|nr:hypothetical protein [Allomuricauda olearia]KAB7530481.1 hypothetical protein F8C76_02955 [Allomuricauda olearia]